jgi:hypothetical protein
VLPGLSMNRRSIYRELAGNGAAALPTKPCARYQQRTAFSTEFLAGCHCNPVSRQVIKRCSLLTLFPDGTITIFLFWYFSTSLLSTGDNCYEYTINIY